MRWWIASSATSHRKGLSPWPSTLMTRRRSEPRAMNRVRWRVGQAGQAKVLYGKGVCDVREHQPPTKVSLGVRRRGFTLSLSARVRPIQNQDSRHHRRQRGSGRGLLASGGDRRPMTKVIVSSSQFQLSRATPLHDPDIQLPAGPSSRRWGRSAPLPGSVGPSDYLSTPAQPCLK